jgi:nucleotide-binding universal stress UspA family protein
MPKGPKNVLCYIDYNTHSKDVLEYAHTLSKASDAELYILHTVSDIYSITGFYIPHANIGKLEDEMLQSAKDKMYSIASHVIGDTKPGNRIVKRGQAVTVIDEVVKDKKIDLLVIAYAAKKGMFGTEFVDRLLKHPPCPVLLLPV